MKPVAILLAAPALLTRVVASPANHDPNLYSFPLVEPDTPDSLKLSGREELALLEGRELLSLDPRCTFHDGHGTVPCDHFSIVFGDGNILGHTNVVTIMANNFKQKKTLDCKKSPTEFVGWNTPLPFVVMIASGNTCRDWKNKNDGYDGLVRNYLPAPQPTPGMALHEPRQIII